MIRWIVLALLCLGCSSLPAPAEVQAKATEVQAKAAELKEKTDAAIGNVCKAATTLCNIYVTLPAEARSPADDRDCADALAYCALVAP